MAETTIEIKLPKELKAQIKEHPEIDWSKLFKKAASETLHKLSLLEFIGTKLDKSEFTEQDAIELSELSKENRLKELKSKGIINETSS